MASLVLTADQVVEIRRRATAGESFSSLARAFEVDRATIKRAACGLTWKGLDGSLSATPAWGTVLTPEHVVDVRRCAASGESFADIARRHGVSHNAVRAAARGFTWKDVPGALPALPATPRRRGPAPLTMKGAS